MEFDAIEDMQRAIRILRVHKDELSISDKITVMGFSAGGMLNANCATHFDEGNTNSSDIIARQSLADYIENLIRNEVF